MYTCACTYTVHVYILYSMHVPRTCACMYMYMNNRVHSAPQSKKKENREERTTHHKTNSIAQQNQKNIHVYMYSSFMYMYMYIESRLAAVFSQFSKIHVVLSLFIMYMYMYIYKYMYVHVQYMHVCALHFMLGSPSTPKSSVDKWRLTAMAKLTENRYCTCILYYCTCIATVLLCCVMIYSLFHYRSSPSLPPLPLSFSPSLLLLLPPFTNFTHYIHVYMYMCTSLSLSLLPLLSPLSVLSPSLPLSLTLPLSLPPPLSLPSFPQGGGSAMALSPHTQPLSQWHHSLGRLPASLASS